MRRGLLAGPPSGMGSRVSSPRISLGSMAEPDGSAVDCHRGGTLATAHHTFIPSVCMERGWGEALGRCWRTHKSVQSGGRRLSRSCVAGEAGGGSGERGAAVELPDGEMHLGRVEERLHPCQTAQCSQRG